MVPPWLGSVPVRSARLDVLSAVVKALSIRQPWAELILARRKDVENRSWKTNLRGSLLIHASKTIERAAMEEYEYDELPTGVLLGVVEVVDCTQKRTSEWHNRGAWGWYLDKPRRFREPIAWKGAVGFMNVPDELVADAIATARRVRRPRA